MPEMSTAKPRRATKRPAPKAVVSAARNETRTSPPEVINITAIDRNALIAEAAYLRAERRGFAPGNELEDWLVAEKDVDARLIARADHGTTPA